MYSARIAASRQRRRLVLSREEAGEKTPVPQPDAVADEDETDRVIESPEPVVDETATLVIEAAPCPVETLEVTEPTAEIDPAWNTLAPLLRTPKPCVWLFSGKRFIPAESAVRRLTGEVFAECFRTATNRGTDVFIDSTRPQLTVTEFWDQFAECVLRFRPEVAFLFVDDSDASLGRHKLSRFERRLEAMITAVRSTNGVPVFVPCYETVAEDDIDRLVYREAIVGVSRERGVLVVDDLSEAASRGPESLGHELFDRFSNAVLEQRVTNRMASDPA